MRRVLSIWFPHLPLNRLVRRGDSRVETSFAIIAESKNAWRLTHVSEAANKAGISPGMSLPDARAICPELLTQPRNEVRDAGLLRALWRWADRLSPIVSLDPPDGLYLDITGCAHIFGDEEAMCVYARTELANMEIDAQTGIADTKGAAWALARFSKAPIAIAEPGQALAALTAMPLAALNLPDAVLIDLRRTGLQTVGQVSAIKSSQLARRFGLDLTRTLSGTLGYTPDPLTPKRADPVFAARMTIPEPIGYLDDLNAVLERLSSSVCDRLKVSARGARRFRLTVRCVDTGDHVLTIGFAKPCTEVKAILQQFAKPLDDLKIEYGADWFRLEAENVEPLQPHQTSLTTTIETEEDTAQLITTLGNRLGFDRVRQFTAQNSYLPEHEYKTVEAINRRDEPIWKHCPRKRPIRLYKKPERLRTLIPGRPPQKFEWRHTTYETKTSCGPERLTHEWWQDRQNLTRDYWRVQTKNGPRLWLMTYPGHKRPDWFVAGKFP